MKFLTLYKKYNGGENDDISTIALRDQLLYSAYGCMHSRMRLHKDRNGMRHIVYLFLGLHYSCRIYFWRLCMPKRRCELWNELLERRSLLAEAYARGNGARLLLLEQQCFVLRNPKQQNPLLARLHLDIFYDPALQGRARNRMYAAMRRWDDYRASTLSQEVWTKRFCLDMEALWDSLR